MSRGRGNKPPHATTQLDDAHVACKRPLLHHHMVVAMHPDLLYLDAAEGMEGGRGTREVEDHADLGMLETSCTC